MFKKSMLSFMLVFFFCSLFVFSCDLKSDQKKKLQEQEQKDSRLQTLVIKHGSVQLKSLSSPINLKFEVQLKKDVTAQDYIEVIATPKDSKAKVKIDRNEGNTKKYTAFVSKVEIVVENGNSRSEYEITFLEKLQEENKEAILQKLLVRQANKDVQSFEKPATSNIDADLNVTLKKKITTSDFVEVVATATVNTAKIEIDGEAVSIKKYTSLPTKAIEIKITNGANMASHTLMLEEPNILDPPDTPDPPSPPPPTEYTVQCNVIDSIGGTNVKGVEIKAYKAGKTVVVQTETTDLAGNAYFTLPADNYYDFVLQKAGRASSRVENVFVNKMKKEYLSIPMREWSVGTKAIAPKIGEVIFLNNNTGESSTVDANTEIDCIKMTKQHYLYVTTKSLSGEIIPYESDNSGIFSISMNIDSSFSGNSGWGRIWPTRFTQESGKLLIEESDGSLRQAWGFSLGGLMVKNGKATIHFVCYDQAGNRCERQEIVKFRNGSISDTVNQQNGFKVFDAESKRYYRSLKLYGMNEESGGVTSCRVIFKFQFNIKEEVGRVDILRRPYEDGNITEHWQKVYTKQYKAGYRGEYSRGMFRLPDDSGTLEEGKVYQYKLVAYTKRGKIESKVATLRVMEAFNLDLVNPSHRKLIDLKDIQNTDFSFRISDPSLWDKERSDYFAFDILVTEDMTASSGSTLNHGVCFASKCIYYLNGPEEDALYISDSSQYKTHKQLLGGSSKIADLINYDKGLITLKAKFMNNGALSLGAMPLNRSINKAGMYYWDVQSFYKKDALDATNNEAAYFAKAYPILDSKTGNKIDGEFSTSYSYANIDGASGAINGRSLFIVKK